MNILKNTKALIALSVVVAAIGGSQVYACRDTFAALAHEKQRQRALLRKKRLKKVSPSVKKESSSESSATETSSVSESSSSVAQSSSVASSSSDAQSSSQATTQAQTATQQSSQTTQAQSQAQQSSSQQPAQTSGFCLNGHSYPIRSFSGTGSVPADGNVYAWTSLPNYYLFEMMGAAHSQLGSLHVGSEVVINGRVLHVSEIMYGVKMTERAWKSFQTSWHNTVLVGKRANRLATIRL